MIGLQRSTRFFGLLIFTLVPAILTTPYINISDSLSFGYHCNETARCDSNKSLSCQNSSCECRNPESMVYDPERGTCVIIAERACIIEDPVSLTLNSAISLQAPGVRQLPCVRNAFCDISTKTCKCDEELLMPSINGSCIPKNLLNGSCTTSAECRQDLGLLCGNSGRCVCNPDLSVENNGTCVGQAEKPCIKDMCTANAVCVDAAEGMLDPSLSASTSKDETTSTKICQCTDEYDPTPNGLCAKDYGIKCDGYRKCKPWLRCSSADGDNGYCECPYPAGQFYDSYRGTCVSRVNYPCNANYSGENTTETETACNLLSVCVKNSPESLAYEQYNFDQNLTHHCECEKGFVENEKLGCDLEFGSTCREESQQDEGQDLSFICDRVGRTKCIDTVCQCADPLYEYDKEQGVCLGLVGAECNLYAEPLSVKGRIKTKLDTRNSSDADIPPQNWCTRGAKCVPFAADASEGTCQCVSRGVGKGKCSERNVPVMIIIGISLAAIFTFVAIFICYFCLKRQGLLVSNAML